MRSRGRTRAGTLLLAATLLGILAASALALFLLRARRDLATLRSRVESLDAERAEARREPAGREAPDEATRERIHRALDRLREVRGELDRVRAEFPPPDRDRMVTTGLGTMPQKIPVETSLEGLILLQSEVMEELLSELARLADRFSRKK